MIPDEPEEDDGKINFYWFYAVGITRLNLTLKQIGRMTLTNFNRLYAEYKKIFDFELLLKKTGTTYEKAEEKAQKADEWF